MRVAIEAVVSGTPGGVMWGESPEGLPVLAVVGSGARMLVVFDSAREAIDFGAQASFAGVSMMMKAAGARGHAEPGEAAPASSLVGADGLPLMRGN